MRCINVVGGSGSGKSNFSKRISAKLNLACIELDAINWQENWQDMKADEFRNRVTQLISSNPEGWVIDGAYHHKLGDLIWKHADVIVFLKTPLYKSLPRVIVRSTEHIFSDSLLWGTNKETFRSALTLWWWTVKYHRKRIKLMADYSATLDQRKTLYLVFKSNRSAIKWLEQL